MKTRSLKASRPKQTRQPARHSTKRAAAKATLKQHRSGYPIHKRMMLHPMSIFIFLCAGVFMAGWTYHVVAATIISSTIEAPPLTAAATLDTPADNAAFTTAGPVHVTGSCPSDSYVKVAVNGSFNGVAWCSGDGTYDITTSLFRGSDSVVVQDYNQTDLAGPATPGITVTYNPPFTHSLRSLPSSSGGSTSGSGTSGTSDNSSSNPPASDTPQTSGTSQGTDNSSTDDTSPVVKPLLLTSDFQFHTFASQTSFSWSVDLEGGSPPYDVLVNWGDGTTSRLRFPGDPIFSLRHTYKTSGYFAVVVNSTDSAGAQHVVQLAALITDKLGNAPFLTSGNIHTPPASSGESQGISQTAQSVSLSNIKWLLLAWPFYLVVILMTVSFWLGEKRELAVVTVRHRR
jgi:hypothetical protein